MTSKDTIFLHIGMHKTASTSIQFSLKNFTDGTTRCARLNRANHSVDMITAFADDPARHPYYTKRQTGAGTVARKRDEIRQMLDRELASPERNLILSGEEMSTFAPSDVARMQRHLAPHCDRLRVIAYVRDPVGFASSAFQQIVRHRKVKGIRILRPDYRRKFAPYLDVFGPDAVELIPFAPDRFRNHCILTDFCDRVGIDAARIEKLTRNESLSAEVVALLLEWNRGGMASSGSPAHVSALGPMVALLRAEFPGTFRFDPDRVRADQDPGDRDWIEARMGAPLPDPAASPGDIGSEADLRARGQGALADLHAILARHALSARDGSAAAMMDALYAMMLEREQEKALNRA